MQANGRCFAKMPLRSLSIPVVFRDGVHEKHPQKYRVPIREDDPGNIEWFQVLFHRTFHR